MTGRKKTPNILGELLGRAPGVSEAEETAAVKPASKPTRRVPAQQAKKRPAVKPKPTETTQAVIASEAKQSPSRKEEIASSQKPLLAMTKTARRLDTTPAEPVGLAGNGPVRFVGFRLDGRLYALPLDHVERALRMVAVTSVPEAPPWVAGVIDLHGQVISVLDLRRRFGQPAVPPHPDQRLLIVHTRERKLAVMVDEVTEVLEVPAQQLKSSSDLVPDSRPLAAVIRRNGDLILVLDATRLMPPQGDANTQHATRFTLDGDK